MSLLRPFKRLLIKISGELLQGSRPFGLDAQAIECLCKDIAGLLVHHKVALVVGGGNFFRGSQSEGFLRQEADEIGMLATVMNAKALRAMFRSLDVPCTLLSTRGDRPYDSHHARSALDDGHIVLCAGGAGNAFMTTDTAAVIRAGELNCDVLLKATQVDGIYSADPLKNLNAVFYPDLSYQEILDKRLRVMDMTAFTLAQDLSLPMIVFSMKEGLHSLLSQKTRHTYVHA